ncbi:hypothetical protein [Myxococcus eversor]|uniref:hypothetical protein n=1 Tax=Myxococcus eversor TaxID=2709661 RepID=UPI0013D4B2D9|nr:hypothetical protein [Myxococcus eversor]
MLELANGKYRARGVQGALGVAGTGAEQVAVEFQLLGNDGSEHYVGQSITWFGFFGDASLEHTIKGLRACGWQGDDVSDLTGVDTYEVILVIENETYRNETRPKVKWVNSMGSGVALKQQMEPTQARTFAQQMRRRILALEQGTGPRSTPAPQQQRGTQPHRGAPPPSQQRGGNRSAPSGSRGGAYQDDVPPPGDDDNIPF